MNDDFKKRNRVTFFKIYQMHYIDRRVTIRNFLFQNQWSRWDSALGFLPNYPHTSCYSTRWSTKKTLNFARCRYKTEVCNKEGCDVTRMGWMTQWSYTDLANIICILAGDNTTKDFASLCWRHSLYGSPEPRYIPKALRSETVKQQRFNRTSKQQWGDLIYAGRKWYPAAQSLKISLCLTKYHCIKRILCLTNYHSMKTYPGLN